MVGVLERVCEAVVVNDLLGPKRWARFVCTLTPLISVGYEREALEGRCSIATHSMKRSLAFASVLSLAFVPVAGFAGTSAQIEATGSAPAFCDISNTGAAISMTISPAKDKLTGTGTYEFTANGDAKVSISAIVPNAPQGAAAYTPSLSLANLVTSTSTTAPVESAVQSGTNKFASIITAEVNQNNAQTILSAGNYSLSATATCTAL